MAKASPLRFMAASYLDRVTDACYVQLGETTVYFSNQKLIAMSIRDTLYRVTESDSAVTHKRVRAALLRANAKKIHQMKREELNALVEEAIMTMASKIIDSKLGVVTV